MAVQRIERPDIVDYEMLEYLDGLKGNSKTFYLSPLVEKKFRVSKEDAREIVQYWVSSYYERHPKNK